MAQRLIQPAQDRRGLDTIREVDATRRARLRCAGKFPRKVWYHVPMKHLLILCLGAGFAAPFVSAQQSLPDGDGKAVMQKICNACHEAEVVIGMKRLGGLFR